MMPDKSVCWIIAGISNCFVAVNDSAADVCCFWRQSSALNIAALQPLPVQNRRFGVICRHIHLMMAFYRLAYMGHILLLWLQSLSLFSIYHAVERLQCNLCLFFCSI